MLKTEFSWFQEMAGKKGWQVTQRKASAESQPSLTWGGGVEMGQGIACQGKDDNDSTLSREGGAAQLRLQEAGGAELTGGAWSGLRRRNV